MVLRIAAAIGFFVSSCFLVHPFDSNRIMPGRMHRHSAPLPVVYWLAFQSVGRSV